VLPYIQDAYHWDVIYYNYNESNPSRQSFVLNVTGTQAVTGNWTNNYDVSYSGNKLLNVTLQYTKPHSYVVTHLAVYDTPDRNDALLFTPAQRQSIRTTLSNSTVRGMMTGPPYFVSLVYPYGGGPLNGTTIVNIRQVNGIREINAAVNSANTAVVFAMVGNDVSSECYANGYCISDPWGANSNAGNVLPPFIVTIAYPGSWSLKILGSDNATGPSAPFEYNKTFTGTGNMTINVPWFSDTGAQTLFASAQKTDGGTATLKLTVNWLSGWPGGTGDPTVETASGVVTTATVFDYQVGA